MLRFVAFATLLAATPVAAQDSALRDCNDEGWGLASVNLTPGGNGVRFFSGGQVTVISLSREEPVCCGAGVAFLFPVQSTEGDGYMRCAMVAGGHMGLDVDKTKSVYDPKRGLTLTIPATAYDHDKGGSKNAPPLVVTINQGTGTIKLGK